MKAIARTVGLALGTLVLWLLAMSFYHDRVDSRRASDRQEALAFYNVCVEFAYDEKGRGICKAEYEADLRAL